jgi:hypothetical protein
VLVAVSFSTMSVKINTGIYISGMPTFDYSIVINGVSILLKKEDFESLTKELGGQVMEDYKNAIETFNKYEKKVSVIQDLRKDLLPIFYSNEGDGDDYFFRKSANEVDDKKLCDVLEKYERFFGFS